MQRLFSMVGSLAVAGALLAGCGSDDKKSSKMATAPSAPSAAPAPAASGPLVTVQMKNTSFVPREVRAKVGQTVAWTNDDPYNHNVKATKGEDFESHDFGQGGTYSYKLKKAGTISYECTLHPGMTGTITVTK